MLVSPNNEMAAMLVSRPNPPGIESYYYANVFFCFRWKTWLLITWVKPKNCISSVLSRETLLSWHSKCSLPVSVRVSKRRVLNIKCSPISLISWCAVWLQMKWIICELRIWNKVKLWSSYMIHFIYHFIVDSFLTGTLEPTNDQLPTLLAS